MADLGLWQEMYKTSLKFLVTPESKEANVKRFPLTKGGQFELH